MQSRSDKKVYEPEVLPPEEKESFSSAGRGSASSWSVFTPILAGLFIDLVDFLTWGPHGLRKGLVVGGVTGLWLGWLNKMPLSKSVIGALLAGIYCAVPFTERLPLATIITTCFCFRDIRRKG